MIAGERLYIPNRVVFNIEDERECNTEKAALRIRDTVEELGHEVDTVKIAGKDMASDNLEYDLVFVGSGVYRQLPGKPLRTFSGSTYKNMPRLGK